MKAYKTLSKKIVHKNPYYRVSHEKYSLPGGGKGDYYVVRDQGSVMIIPFLDSKTILLNKQYRYIFKKWSLEFPGGRLDKRKNIKKVALQELEEEIGYTSKKLIKIGEFNPYNGMVDEVAHVFIAKDLKPVGQDLKPVGQDLENTESIKVQKVKIKDFEKMLKDGKIDCGMAIAGWQLYTCLSAGRKANFK